MINNRFSNQSVIKIIRDIEENYPVENWMINGIHIWPIIRNSLPSHYINNGKSQAEKNNDYNKKKSVTTSVVKKIISFATSFTNSIKLVIKIFFLRSRDVLFIGDGISYLRLNDKWIDRFCDPIVDNLIEKGQTFLLLEQLKFTKKQVLNRYYEIESLSKMCYYVARLLGFSGIIDKNLEHYDQFLKAFKNHGYNKAFSLKEMYLITKRIKLICLFFNFLIKRLSIKKAFIVCYYGDIGYALALAGRKQKIDVIDLEHGSIINCPAYCDWKKSPENGYNIIPSYFNLWHPLLSSVFEKTNNKIFKKWHKCFVGGLKIIDYLKQQEKSYTNENLLTLKKRFKNLILVTLQPQFYGYKDWDKLAQSITMLPKDWGWIIRSHPAYVNQEGMESLLSLKKNNIFYDKNHINLYTCLNYVDCHITTASASCLEAMIFNVPTLFISKVGIEDFNILIKNNIAYYAKDVPTIVSKLHFILDKND